MKGRGGKRDQGQFEERWDQVCDNLQNILIDSQKIVTIFLLLFSRDREELLIALQKDIERRRLLK